MVLWNNNWLLYVSVHSFILSHLLNTKSLAGEITAGRFMLAHVLACTGDFTD